MDIDLTRLRHIAAIARTGSFSRAAEDLHITQPALSRSIASFEQRHVLRELVISSDCVWLAAPSVLADDITAGRLAALEVADYSSINSDIAVIQRRGRTLSPAAKALVEHLSALLSVHGRTLVS